MGELAPAENTGRFMHTLFAHHSYQADGFAVHPYQYCTAPDSRGSHFVTPECNYVAGAKYGIAWASDWQSRLKHLHTAGRLSTPGGEKVPLYFTEFGYHRNTPPLPEPARAAWYPRAMSVAKEAGARSMNIYQLVAGAGMDDASTWDTGLVLNGVPLPSFVALQDWSRKNGYPVRN